MNDQMELLKNEGAERTAEIVALEIKTLQRQAQGIILTYAVEIGRRLEEAKAMLNHGEWGDWLKRELDYSPSTAQNFMRVYREYGHGQQNLFNSSKSQALGDLTYTKALRLLAIPDEEERERFVAENDVASMSTRELEQAIRERDAAEERAKAAVSEQEQLSATLRQADIRIAEMEKDLRALQDRPTDVAIETVVDQEAVEKARKEAIAEMQKKLDKAKADKAKAEEKQKAAVDELAAARQKMQDLKKTAADAASAAHAEDAEKLRAMEKQLAAADPDAAEFKVLFTAWQEDYRKMREVLHRVDQTDAEKAAKFRRAMEAAMENMKA